MNPFDYVKSITTTKENLMRDSANDELAEKEYHPFLVNKSLSYFPDTILHANLMNENYHLDNRPQYEFLINSIRSKKRFAKWIKDEETIDLDAICEYYKCNRTRGREYMLLLSVEQITKIKEKIQIGEVKK